jgi:hypothetical protein
MGDADTSAPVHDPGEVNDQQLRLLANLDQA